MHNFYSLTSTKKHLFIFTLKETIFIWSKTTCSLYSFSGFYAALFLFVEEDCNYSHIEKFITSAGHVFDNTFKLLVESMVNLINNDENILNKERYITQQIPLIQTEISPKNIYYIYNTYFSIDVDKELKNYILDSFKHIQIFNTQAGLKYHFSVLQNSKFYEITVNGKSMEKVKDKEKILPILQDLIRITIYENSDFKVAMHSGVLEYESKTLILPGASGAGKSTLSSYLMHKGFQLYSDEVTAIDSKNRIHSLLLCNTIKEGSWKVINTFSKVLNDLSIHKRFDEQKIKFLPPLGSPTKSLNAIGSFIIFTNFQKKSKTLLKSVTLVQAISLFIESGYHLKNPENIKNVKFFLNFLSSCHIYTLIYSNLEEAKNTIKAVIKK